MDLRLLEALAKVRKPASANYVSEFIGASANEVSQGLANLAPLVLREKRTVRKSASGDRQVWVYRLRSPEAVSTWLFARKTCPDPKILSIVM